MGVQISHNKGQIFRSNGVAHLNIYGECSIGSGKTVELIELPFGMVSGVGLRNHALDGMHIGTTWKIWLNNCSRQL